MAVGHATLENRNWSFRDAAQADDACAIAFDTSEWSSIDPSEDNYWSWAWTDATGSVDIELNHYNANYGVNSRVDLPYGLNGKTEFGCQTYVTPADTGNGNIPVKFEHVHTGAGSSWIGNVSIGVSGGALSVSFTLPGGRKFRRAVVTAEP